MNGEQMNISDADLDMLEGLARKASQAGWEIGQSATETHEAATEYVTKSIAQSDDPNLWMVFFDQDDPKVVCYTGNGPTSEANAFYIANVMPKNMLLLIEDLRNTRAELARLKGAADE